MIECGPERTPLVGIRHNEPSSAGKVSGIHWTGSAARIGPDIIQQVLSCFIHLLPRNGGDISPRHVLLILPPRMSHLPLGRAFSTLGESVQILGARHQPERVDAQGGTANEAKPLAAFTQQTKATEDLRKDLRKTAEQHRQFCCAAPRHEG